MLGYMVTKILSKESMFILSGTQPEKNEKWKHFDILKNAAQIKKLFNEIKPDYCINCIGITKNKILETDVSSVARAIQINALFPHELSFLAGQSGARVIQISTDAVFSGGTDSYNEDSICDCTDIYGRTKTLGEVDAANFLNIRCSIIGPSPFQKGGLYEWFMSQPAGAQIHGYTNNIWKGVTTLQFARLCVNIIRKDLFEQMRKESKVFHFAPNKPVSKYELLILLKKAFRKNITVIPAKDKSAGNIKRILFSKFKIMKLLFPKNNPMHIAIKELAKEQKGIINKK